MRTGRYAEGSAGVSEFLRELRCNRRSCGIIAQEGISRKGRIAEWKSGLIR